MDKLASKFGNDVVCFHKCDVTKDDEFEQAFVKCRENFGGIDILVNNAGINGEVDWEKTINTNLGVRKSYF